MGHKDPTLLLMVVNFTWRVSGFVECWLHSPFVVETKGELYNLPSIFCIISHTTDPIPVPKPLYHEDFEHLGNVELYNTPNIVLGKVCLLQIYSYNCERCIFFLEKYISWWTLQRQSSSFRLVMQLDFIPGTKNMQNSQTYIMFPAWSNHPTAPRVQHWPCGWK